ncbi:winged helix-turn-helix domain-containing protein [Curvibacter sp. CHRR-16]|uniref:winged helix-turn-helix domain-containing protein n=1 Tax=Curvibacter sp. CHRR-16 TaxID=2835872 RepID=UPI001BDB2565|nr:winged helix-turn-helix domain-containing protein [Curvibacter sp. CHRR-16]MBT0571651.1 winged helix-turn-helix domain-containing protein [Curvibacter sp. CHRR-16]
MHTQRFKFRARLTVGDAIALGPGKVALLEALQQYGSISAAAQSLGMSYRRAWLLIDELNRCLREPAVQSATGGSKGGGSQLTPTGLAIVALYRRIEATAEQACTDDIAALKAFMQS